MKDRKKTILIVLLVICVLISIIAIILSNKNVDNDKDNNNNNSNEVENTPQNYFSKVTDYNEFFSIQNTLNNEGDLNTSYIIKEIYLNRIGNTKYYFINCSAFESDMILETVKYTKNNYYLMVVNNNYELNKIYVDDLYNYAKTYKVINRNISSGKTLKSGNTSTENILSIYLAYFKDLLASDPEEAYNMLALETKEKYRGYEDFRSNRIDIYNKLSTRIFSHSSIENDDKITYYIDDNNRNKIIIYEEEIMNFKILY